MSEAMEPAFAGQEPAAAQAYPPKPELASANTNSVQRTIFSLLLYVAVCYFFFNKDWSLILPLAAIILVHELGHFIAMKLLGYRDVGIIFIPFLGAVTQGTRTHRSQWRKVVVLLAGPVPGVLLGSAFYLVYLQTGHPLLYKVAFLAILLNSLNLLPVSPLDGGQLTEALFLQSAHKLLTAFVLLSTALIVWYVIDHRAYALLIIAVMLPTRLLLMRANINCRKALDKAGIDYRKSYEELTDAEYWEIRRCLIAVNSGFRDYDPDIPSDNEKPVIKAVQDVLHQPLQNDLSLLQKILIVVGWLLFMAGPLLYWWQLRYG